MIKGVFMEDSEWESAGLYSHVNELLNWAAGVLALGMALALAVFLIAGGTGSVRGQQSGHIRAVSDQNERIEMERRLATVESNIANLAQSETRNMETHKQILEHLLTLTRNTNWIVGVAAAFLGIHGFLFISDRLRGKHRCNYKKKECE